MNFLFPFFVFSLNNELNILNNELNECNEYAITMNNNYLQ